MAAPKGNQYAKDHGCGRPAIDKEQLAIDLLQWVSYPDSINFNQFCWTHKPPVTPNNIMRYARESEVFSDAYELAKSCVAARRELMLTNNELHIRAYENNKHVYDLFLKAEDREQSKFENDLKKEVADDVSEEYKHLMNGVMNQLRSIQPERKQSNISSNDETKSA